jgi:2-dehydropantoate 2-reductase
MSTLAILGAGVVGSALAVHLLRAGRQVVLVHTRPDAIPEPLHLVRLQTNGVLLEVPVPCLPLASLGAWDGILVVTAKAFANASLATALQPARNRAQVVLLQNGLGVEAPLLQAGFAEVHRATLYVTGQRDASGAIAFQSVQSSPVGTVRGSRPVLEQIVQQLATPALPFHPVDDIQACIWKKTIVNCVFNSICPLLEADNGIFARDPACLELAHQVVDECLQVAAGDSILLDPVDLIGQILRISTGSNHRISTLQDLHEGRPTEIAFLNPAVVQRAESLNLPPPRLTRQLGELVAAKARLAAQPPVSRN